MGGTCLLLAGDVKDKNFGDKELIAIKEFIESTADSRLVEDLHFDSLAVMMLAMNIEDAYNISFDGPMNFHTVKDVMDYIENSKK